MFGNSIAMAQKALDCLWKKQEAINNNLANVDTPGYKRKQVSFEETYRQKLTAAAETKSDRKIKEAIAQTDYTVSSRDDSARVDENNVNADVENVEMTRTWLHYYYLLQSVTSDIKIYQTAIKGQ